VGVFLWVRYPCTVGGIRAKSTPAASNTRAEEDGLGGIEGVLWGVEYKEIPRDFDQCDRLTLGGVPRQQKMLKGHPPRVIAPRILVNEEKRRAGRWGGGVTRSVQGYLAHQKQPPPSGPP